MRHISTFCGAVIISLLLFWIMQALIAPGTSIPAAAKSYQTVKYVKLPPKKPKKKPLLKKKEPLAVITKPPAIPHLTSLNEPLPELTDIHVDIPDLNGPPPLFSLPGDISVTVKTGGAAYGGLGDATDYDSFKKEIIPLGTIQPAYPKTAAERRIEGWVDVEFTINKGGWVEDVMVLNSDPKGIFEQNTVNAVYTWKFEKMDTPIRARQHIEFRLEQLKYFVD